LMSDKFTGLNCKLIQVDELWGFIGAKKKTVKQKNLGPEFGDVWTWVALDAETKLVPTIVVGNRDQYHANIFMDDLASRLISRPQISSDALAAYQGAIERAFGCEVDYGSVIKTFSHTDLEEQRRYSPPSVLKIKKSAVQGDPDMNLVSTSYVEKQNQFGFSVQRHPSPNITELGSEILLFHGFLFGADEAPQPYGSDALSALSRLTNAFSKKRENFEAAISLHYAYYNFCKRHQTIRCTPAMEAGIEKSQWTVADLVETIEGK